VDRVGAQEGERDPGLLLVLLTLFIYALYRLDPVFILGQGAGLFVYLRNLYLIRRKQSALAEARA
jgi:lipid-A-disaccharide synthase-like uncharacterized protein